MLTFVSFCRREELLPPIHEIHAEFNRLYAAVSKIKSPTVFAHNDLLLGNILYDASEEKVTFIDYEYADYNFQAFDIGNHFTEFAGMHRTVFTYYFTVSILKTLKLNALE